MPANDREVYDFLRSDPDSSDQEDFIAYAIFAFHKEQWVALYKQRNNGQEPPQQDIDTWISNLTDRQFDDMKDEAARFFASAAKEYMADEIEEEKKKAVEKSILSEVKGFTSPWRHFGIALIMAILAPVVLGGIVFFAGVFDKSFPIQVSFPHKEQKKCPEIVIT